jgi:2-succinyl-6-hydroxy-2,4-cyclohexadiene-1-carboxylate synthase
MGTNQVYDLVLLHGFLGESSDWDQFHLPLAPHRLHCLDLPFHGQNSTDKNHSDFFNRLSDLLKTLNSAVLVGYSMGGRLALEFALTQEHQLKGLALIAPDPGIEDEIEREKRFELDQKRAAAIQSDRSLFIEHWYRAPLFGQIIHDPNFEKTLLKRKNSLAPWHQAVTTFSPGNSPNLWPLLPTLSLPTLYFSGEHDQKYQLIGQRLRPFGVKALTLPNAHHMAHIQAPEAFARGLSDFLGTLSSSATK